MMTHTIQNNQDDFRIQITPWIFTEKPAIVIHVGCLVVTSLVVVLPASRFISLIGFISIQWLPEAVSSAFIGTTPGKSKSDPEEPN